MLRNYNPKCSEHKTYQLLDKCFNRDINKFKYTVSNTRVHEVAKFIKFMELRDEGHMVVCEGIFENGQGRADLIDLTEGIAYEIVGTKTEKSLITKKFKYPIPIEVINAKEYVETHKLIEKIVKGDKI